MCSTGKTLFSLANPFNFESSARFDIHLPSYNYALHNYYTVEDPIHGDSQDCGTHAWCAPA